MIQIDTSKHLIKGIRYVASPHCDDRPDETTPDLVVVHCISVPAGLYGGSQIEKLFTGTLSPKDGDEVYAELGDMRVSAHLLIRRDGELLQFVPFDKRAWHAGESNYCGRKMCNDFSIGIELEGCDRDVYEQVQYDRLREVTRALLNAYPTLSTEHIVGHSDIAPLRKTDPGPKFDWQLFRKGL